MGLYLHLRDKVFRVRDQAALPVPLDPDLLFLAEQAKSQNVVQDIYRLQMERNRSRAQFGDHKGHAKQGGQTGVNGEWYEGGMFLPSSKHTKKGQTRFGGPSIKHVSSDEVTTEPGKKQKPPSPLHRSIFDLISTWTREAREGREYLDVPYAERAAAKAKGAKFDWDRKKWYMEKKGQGNKLELREGVHIGYGSDSEPLTREVDFTPGVAGHKSTQKMTMGDLLDRYNRGERWVKVKLPPGVEAPEFRDADWEEHEHPRDESGQFTSGGGSKVTPKRVAHKSGGNEYRNYRESVEDVPIEWLKKLPGNTMRHDNDWLWDLGKDIKENGLESPLIIHVGKKSRTVKLGEGNHRLRAMQMHGFTHVPARVVVGSEWGSESKRQPEGIANDIIPEADRYFKSDAAPSEVFRSLKSHDAEFKEHEHPRNKGGQFTSKGHEGEGGAAKEPPKEIPSPGETAPSSERYAPYWGSDFAKFGFEYQRMDHDGDQDIVILKNNKTGAALRVDVDKDTDAIGDWKLFNKDGGIDRGYGRHDLEEHLHTVSPVGPKPPPKLRDMLMQSGSLRYDSYDEKIQRWTFRNDWGDETLEYSKEKLPGMGGSFWEHKTPSHRYNGYGDGNLRRHLERHSKGDFYDSKFSKHWGDVVTPHGFDLFLESDTSAAYKNADGDQIFIYKDVGVGHGPEDAKWRLVNGEDHMTYNDGKGWDDLHENLKMLQDEREGQKEKVRKEEARTTEEYTTIAAGMMKRLGYPPSKLTISHESKTFVLNGVTSHYAGACDLASGEITLYPKHLTVAAIEGVTAHEVMHAKFQSVLNEYEVEMGEVQADRRSDVGSEQRFVIKNDGTLREEYAGDYPVYESVQPILLNKRQQLIDEDGVTRYSQEWWRNYENDNSKWAWERAVHETLAEMAYLEVTDPAKFKDVKQPWRDLYRNVVTLYRNTEPRKNEKALHGRERQSWRQPKEMEGGGIYGSAPPSGFVPGHEAKPRTREEHDQQSRWHESEGERYRKSAEAFRMRKRHGLASEEERKADHHFEQSQWHLARSEATGDREWHEEDVTRNEAKGHEGEFASQGGGGAKAAETKPHEPQTKPKPLIPTKPAKPALKGNAANSHAATIPTRRPSAKGSVEDRYLRADLDAMRQHEENFEHDTNLFNNPEMYPNFRPGELDCAPVKGDSASSDCSEQRARTIIDHMKQNLRFLYDNAPKVVREQGHQWYEGAHRLAAEDAKKYGLPLQSVVGVYASLSPQKLWDMNVYLAKQVLDTYMTKQNEPWDDKMEKKAPSIVLPKKPKPKPEWTPEQIERADKRYQDKLEAAHKVLAELKGKKLSELDDVTQKAWWIRIYDEAHHNRHFDALSPDGRVVGTYKTQKGNPAVAAWNTNSATINALTALMSGGDRDIISPAMGSKHKVRSFYNNILDPDSDNGDVTVDTHAVGAALLAPYGGSHTSVMHSLGMSPSSKAETEKLHFTGATSNAATGLDGTYALYAEAYRELAETLKIKPRVLQSITWEAKRRLFDEHMKDEAKQQVAAAWRKYHEGNASLDKTQKDIVRIAGGFAKGQGESDNDDTGRQPNRKDHAQAEHTGDARQFHPHELGRGRTRTVDTGRRGRDPRGVAAGARRIWESARLTVFLR